jgi:hypothetical protein
LSERAGLNNKGHVSEGSRARPKAATLFTVGRQMRQPIPYHGS